MKGQRRGKEDEAQEIKMQVGDERSGDAEG